MIWISAVGLQPSWGILYLVFDAVVKVGRRGQADLKRKEYISTEFENTGHDLFFDTQHLYLRIKEGMVSHSARSK